MNGLKNIIMKEKYHDIKIIVATNHVSYVKDFIYQNLDKKYIDEKWLKALDEEAIELEPWDPFGALARLK